MSVPVDKMLKHDHSNESYKEALSCIGVWVLISSKLKFLETLLNLYIGNFRRYRLECKEKHNNKGYFRPACPLICPLGCPLVSAGPSTLGSRGGCWRRAWRETSANSLFVRDSIRERHSVDTAVQLSGRPPVQQGKKIRLGS